jgi:hypothetical protein
MANVVKRFIDSWIVRQSEPHRLIAQAGGTHTDATIDGFIDTTQGRALTYHYTARWIPEYHYTHIRSGIANRERQVRALRQIQPTEESHLYSDRIQMDWDIQDHLLHGGTLPRWCLRYDQNYQFTIWYLNANPRIHVIVDGFDFSQ